ncbi:MAG: acylneuraminate cytidylyltransferase family protein [Gemmatimonadetes bacterium]|nr:acylneuraminate cytidylyltransferase family protein [Gemmatimonadota bacterium]
MANPLPGASPRWLVGRRPNWPGGGLREGGRIVGTEVVGVITARGGSKSIPRKNLAPLAGKPLIAWTIEAALRSELLGRVILSTDDAEIAEVARRWGAEVPFLRPRELARDDSPHVPVVIHAVEWLERQGAPPKYVLLLQPTSPLRSAEDIDGAIQMAFEKRAASVVSVCEARSHPYLVMRVTPSGRLRPFGPRPRRYLRRQSLPPVHVVNGAIYLVRRDVLMGRRTFYTDRTYAYLMPAERSLDIDTPWDLHLAELILEERRGRERG